LRLSLSLIPGQVVLGHITGRWDEFFHAHDRRTQNRVNVVVWVVPFVFAVYQPAPKRYCLAVLGDQFTYQPDLIGVVTLGMVQEHDAIEAT
jgi:hypothetical protein